MSRIWKANPIFFVTTCTYERKPILDCTEVANILIDEWKGGLERHGWMVGRFVIMPDHVHFFCSLSDQNNQPVMIDLSRFMQQWKQWTSKRIRREIVGNLYLPPTWQKDYFDHMLRSEESYSQKWEYVRENPVRKNLVGSPEEWPWQGEIFPLYV